MNLPIIQFNNYPFKKSTTFHFPKDLIGYKASPFKRHPNDSDKIYKIFVYDILVLQRKYKMDPTKCFKICVCHNIGGCETSILTVSEYEYRASKILD